MLALPATIVALINVRDVRRLLRHGTVFTSTDAVPQSVTTGSGKTACLRVRFSAGGIERAVTFEKAGGISLNTESHPVPVLFDPSKPDLAALLLPDGTAIIGRLAASRSKGCLMLLLVLLGLVLATLAIEVFLIRGMSK